MKLIIALDGMGFDRAFELIVSLGPHVDGFKINHTLWERTSMFTKYEGELFVDLKLWDTPNSVCSVVEMILEKGATMTTISTFNNSEVFQCLHQYSEDIKLLGVTYLTSWNPEEQFQITREMPYNMWRRHIERIKKYGFAGIVCSAQDIQDIKRVDDNLLRVCPGITFKSSNSGQVRTTTPRRAQEDGADYAIIGRSITKANHPVETIEKIKKTLEFRLIP
ncbi:orotidine-5'-phosphate decarboxylase [Marine Group I thaumarchaeote]|uniref:Orotidine 5'-phosphate decarboxylase n=1 Tax=Marine Group I thaumarchaeote TaxID=2511932 RepID=A0A7K4MWN8_9ARCH|nr:orotidine-5'-phosphate decarboxylase [Marine Group I thaumarchaeote]